MRSITRLVVSPKTIAWVEVDHDGTEKAVRMVVRSAIEGGSVVLNDNKEFEVRILTASRCICAFFSDYTAAQAFLAAAVNDPVM